MTLTRGEIESLVVRIQNAFLEFPTLSLTLPTAERWFGADGVTCAAVLDALVEAQVLTRRARGYVRYFPLLAGRWAALGRLLKQSAGQRAEALLPSAHAEGCDDRDSTDVMGVQGRGAVDLLFFGSTTQHVVRDATCPVLMLRRG